MVGGEKGTRDESEGVSHRNSNLFFFSWLARLRGGGGFSFKLVYFVLFAFKRPGHLLDQPGLVSDRMHVCVAIWSLCVVFFFFSFFLFLFLSENPLIARTRFSVKKKNLVGHLLLVLIGL